MGRPWDWQGKPVVEMRALQVEQGGSGPQACLGARGCGWEQRGAKAWPVSLSGAANLRVVTGPAALPSRLGLHPHPAESESQPPGFNPPSGGFYDSSWVALPWGVWWGHLFLCSSSGTPASYWLGVILLLNFSESLPTWPKRLNSMLYKVNLAPELPCSAPPPSPAPP